MADRRGGIVDLFAGAGGWDEGLRQLGHEAVGVEFDQLACATGEAAGHARRLADVAALDPMEFAPLWGLIGSPPCQAYSTAGKNLGRFDKPHVIACAHELAAGADTRAEHATACRDPRSLLTVEPLRWALALRPRWIALEQVPPALELWTIFVGLLATHGYHATAGVLSAEQYGVAQTRKRAFLIASLDGPVELPAPTHRSYNPRNPHEVREGERHLRPWVSMGKALGWRRPGVARTHANTSYGRNPGGASRELNRPAFTLDCSCGAWTFEPIPTDSTTPAGLHPRQGAARVRGIDLPSFTLVASGLAHGQPIWVHERPATTVLGDRRIQPPGHKANATDPPGRYDSRSGTRAARVTVEQATVLQGFRRNYPWQGSRHQQFRQIGNAVCPPVARRVLAAAMREDR
ncbi:MAG TPA: DNA cytosine methyltransferase [Conexibacter sp.]|nr:DNA cytosine methyltransferase [Conexibacter sp.]